MIFAFVLPPFVSDLKDYNGVSGRDYVPCRNFHYDNDENCTEALSIDSKVHSPPDSFQQKKNSYQQDSFSYIQLSEYQIFTL